MATTASSNSTKSFDDLSPNKSDQSLDSIKNVDAREELANPIKERQNKIGDTKDNMHIQE